MKSILLPVSLLVVILAAMDRAPAQSTTDDLAQMLDKTGYRFVKVDDNVYEIPASGKNVKEFTMRITEAQNLLLIVCKVSDRKSVSGRMALRVLELNSDYDIVKFALSRDMLYARIDINRRLVDVEQLKYLIEAMAHVVDSSYPQIKRFAAGAAHKR